MSYRVVRWWVPHNAASGPSLEEKINSEEGVLVSHTPQEAMVDEEFGLVHWLIFETQPQIVQHFAMAVGEFGKIDETKLPSNAITLWRQIVAGIERVKDKLQK
jgi:hypothetical protein